MKKSIMILLAALGIGFMSGCGDPVIDGTDENSFQKSSAHIVRGLDDEQLIEFTAAVTVVGEKEKDPRKALDGMTMREVVEKAREIDAKGFDAKVKELTNLPEDYKIKLFSQVRREADRLVERRN